MEQKKTRKLTKKRYLLGYIVVVALLFVVRLLLPAEATAIRADDGNSTGKTAGHSDGDSDGQLQTPPLPLPLKGGEPARNGGERLRQDGERAHRILSVPGFKETFPDTNAVQLVAAQRWGVLPVKNRADAEARKKELVYVGASPYYHVDPLHQSIPYLVPRAAVLLHDIGQAFFDSLYIKGVPLHRFIVTSVLRTEEDVMRLRRFNGNATENSCHLYGTTFDICYNRYETVRDPEGPARREVRNDTLKYVLSEVLRDMREQHRCFIKYEVKQGCFHMTVR